MRSKSLLLATLILAVVAAGCTSIGPQPTPVAPTKTPKPTFTPTPDWTPTPVVFTTAAPVAAAPTAEAAAPAQPETTAEPAATEAPTAEPTAAESNTVVASDRDADGQRSPRTGHQLPRDRPPEHRASLPCHRQECARGLVPVRPRRQAGLGDRQSGQRQRRPGYHPGGAEHPGSAHRAPDGAAAAPTDFTASAANRNRRRQPAAPSYDVGLASRINSRRSPVRDSPLRRSGTVQEWHATKWGLHLS